MLTSLNSLSFDLLQVATPADNEVPFLCNGCWTKIESFHEFYLMIEDIHKAPFNGLNDNAFNSVNLNLKTDPDENEAATDQENVDFLSAALKCETSKRANIHCWTIFYIHFFFGILCYH